MDEIDVPQYFLCPISLQIMKDPVTTVTGITYDRESIQQWLITAFSNEAASVVCPVTKLPLSPTSDLTPNHMLRRLIQAWCVATGIDRIPTPKFPLQRSLVLKLIRDVNRRGGDADALSALEKLDELSVEDEKNHRCMAEAGVTKAMASFVLRCFKEGKILGLEEALRILQLTWTQTDENKKIVEDGMEFVNSILWVLKSEIMGNTVKTQALAVLKNVTEVASSTLMQKLNLDFFEEMVKFFNKVDASPHAVKSALHILIQTCPVGTNRLKIIEAGGIHEVIEMELRRSEKRTTELAVCLLAHLCSCADGRQQLLKHGAGMAVVAKRLLRNSPATDDWALRVMESIGRCAATREVVVEMLRVGAVSKLCMVLQADCADYLKKKAREILRLHSNAWSNSPCIQLYLITRNPR